MRRISSRSVFLRALLCALVLLLALAPISGAAAATADSDEDVATADESASEAPVVDEEAAVEEEATVTATEDSEESTTEAAEVEQDDVSTAEDSANQDGPYTPDPDAEDQPSGNGQGKTPHDSGSKGNADDKNPPGQMPGPDEDGDVGYECDGNQGVAKGNPAHTQCPPPDPQISIVKTGPATASHGENITYTMTVTNPGNRPLRNVDVDDADCATGPSFTGGDSNGDNVLQTTETWTYTCTRVVDAAEAVNDILHNTATVEGTSPEDVRVDDSDDHQVTLTEQQTNPDISIDKRPAGWDGSGTETQNVAFGGTAAWDITVENTGDVTLTDVEVTDPRAADCVASLGTLEPGEDETYSCELDGVESPFTNLANVTGDDPAGDPVTDSDTSPVTVDELDAGVTITKDPDLQTVVSGGTATWTITVTNTGDVPLTGVNVSDELAEDCVQDIGTLAVGDDESWECSLDDVTEALTNVAVVHTNEVPDEQDTADVSIVPQNQAPSILLRKIAETPTCPKVGDTVDYGFEIINNGNQTLTGVELDDPLLGGPVTLPSTTLTAGQIITAADSYTLTQADIDAGVVNNSATASGLSSSQAPVTNTGAASVMLEDCPGEILLEKDGPASALVGEQITYTFTVTNTGDVTLTNVRIADARLRIRNLRVNPSTLAPGQQGTATASYVVTEADGDAEEILNTAVVRARTPDDTEVDASDDHHTIIPPPLPGPNPGIQLVKDGPASAGVGETVTYTFTVTNTGEVTLTNVNITDPLLGLSRLRVRPSTLAPDEQGTATATYVVTEADAEAGSVYNTAVARGRTPDGTPVRDDDDHTVTVPLTPPLVPPAPPELPATGLGTSGFALTALLSLALGGVLLGVAGSGHLQTAVAGHTVAADSPVLVMLRRWNLAPKPGGSQARRRRRR